MSVKSSIAYVRQANLFALAQRVTMTGDAAERHAVDVWQKEHFIPGEGRPQSCFFVLSSEDMECAIRDYETVCFSYCGRYGTLAWEGKHNFKRHYDALSSYSSFACLPFAESIDSMPKNRQGTRSTSLELKAIELLRAVKGLHFSHEGMTLRGKGGGYHEDGLLREVSRFADEGVAVYLSDDGKTLLEVKGVRGAFTCRGIETLYRD